MSVSSEPGAGGEITIRSNPLVTVALLAATFVVWAFLIFPVVWIVIGSFRTSETMFSSSVLHFTLEHYVTIFEAGFGHFILNSLFICLVAVFISTIVSVMASRSAST